MTMTAGLLAIGEVTRVLVFAGAVIEGVNVVESTDTLQFSGTKTKKIGLFIKISKKSRIGLLNPYGH